MDVLELSLMEPVIIGCGGCGRRICVRYPTQVRERLCPHCNASLNEIVAAKLSALSPWQPDQRVTSDRLACESPKELGTYSDSRATWFSRFASGLRRFRPRLSIAYSLGFLTVTASLIAEALGSLGADDPSYTYQVYQQANLGIAGGSSRGDIHEGKSPRSNEKIVNKTGDPTPALADLPSNVFACPDNSGFVPFPAVIEKSCETKCADVAGAERIKIRGPGGRLLVARLHGGHNGQMTYILPDGQLGIPTRHVPTAEPFVPLRADELQDQLKGTLFSTFQSLKTDHYLVFSQSNSESSRRFAERSSQLLEDLYKGLTETFSKRGIPFHDLEFPLVVVIFDSEKEFRAHKQVDPDVQAYYEIYTNRIYFYETADEDHLAPELSALRKPQTVAHEGTHQILANIGVQPRLSSWPIWLTEGLAEYCASPCRQDRTGQVCWNGLGMINALHMATIRDLEDPRLMLVRSRSSHPSRTGRDPGKPLLESLIRAEKLSPTDYALAWALTHYLALKRGDEFIKFLIEMEKLPPLEPRTADDHVEAFKRAFGSDLAKMDKQIANHLTKLAKQKGYDRLPYYAVMFEQPINGVLRRAAMVSQSPSMIQQWIQEISSPRGAVPSWHVNPLSTRSQAAKAAEEFMRGF